MMGKIIFLLFVVATSAARLGNGGSAPSPASAPGPAGAPGAPESPLDGIKGFVDLLPYSPDRMNYQMTKAKCIDFVNHQLDRSGHDATKLPKLMPKCLWSKEECKTLEDDLLSRIPATALPGGPGGAPAGSPAAALLASKQLRSKSPGSGDAIFGWCDTLYNMAKTRYFEKLKPEKPAPGMDPLPAETGDVHRDIKIMKKWAEKNIGGPPGPELSKTDKIWEKMKQMGNTAKSASGWDHFAPERETAKKMARGVSGADHFSKKDAKDEKEEEEEEEDKKEKEKEKKEKEE